MDLALQNRYKTVTKPLQNRYKLIAMRATMRAAMRATMSVCGLRRFCTSQHTPVQLSTNTSNRDQCGRTELPNPVGLVALIERDEWQP